MLAGFSAADWYVRRVVFWADWRAKGWKRMARRPKRADILAVVMRGEVYVVGGGGGRKEVFPGEVRLFGMRCKLRRFGAKPELGMRVALSCDFRW